MHGQAPIRDCRSKCVTRTAENELDEIGKDDRLAFIYRRIR